MPSKIKNTSQQQNQSFMEPSQLHNHSFGHQDPLDQPKQHNEFLDNLDLDLSNLTGSFGRQTEHREQSLCCKVVFMEGESIQQPESMEYEFKGYKFPLTKDHNEMIKKTICSFLNCRGGYIFIGISENVSTKEHKAYGDIYNEGEKEEVLKIIRKNALFIEPDIVLSKKMEISFIPVKFSFYPYSYIPGRYVVKVKVYPGEKEDLYTVKCDDDLLVCMRTENQVLTFDPKKDLRKMLAIQKNRAKVVFEEPDSFYQHKCKKPDTGVRMFSSTNRLFGKHKFKTLKEANELKAKPRDKISQISQICLKEVQKSSSPSSRQMGSVKKQKWGMSEKFESDSEDRASEDTSSNEREVEKRNKSKKQRKKIKQIEKSRQIYREMDLRQSNEASNRVAKANVRETEVSCERIVERYFTATSQSQEKSKDKDREAKSKEKSQYWSASNPKYEEDRKKPHHYSSKRQQEMHHRSLQQEALEKHIKGMGAKREGALLDFMSYLLILNFDNHKIFGFTGFSKGRLDVIKAELANINENDYFEFSNLLVYRFGNSNQSDLKMAFTRAIQAKTKDQQDQSSERLLNTITFKNTELKRRKNGRSKPKMNLNISYEDSIDESISTSESKCYRIIFKLTNRIKILMYDTLGEETREKIRQKIKDLCRRKNVVESISWDSSNKKVKQMSFPNMYYSLLAFLELRKLSLNLLFY